MWAFKNMAANRVEVHSSTGKLIKSIPMGKYWESFAGWLDNQNLIVVMEEPDLANYTPQPYILAPIKYPREVRVINVFTGKMQSLASNYPNIDLANNGARWDLFGTTMYDPTLTRVIYPGPLNIKVGEVDNGYILYDIPEQKILAEIPNPSWTRYTPKWSPDGSYFIVMGKDEFYLISITGKSTKLTHMNPLFDPITRKGRNYDGIYYDWSPDGKQVAMWLREDFKNQPTLAILDIETGMITNTCILAGFDSDRHQNFPYPVWSPDGKYLVVSANYQADQNIQGHYDVVLVDLEKKAAFKITSNMFPVGWLISQ
jgi:WD40 repeat protein